MLTLTLTLTLTLALTPFSAPAFLLAGRFEEMVSSSRF